jgi:hypothetical protein
VNQELRPVPVGQRLRHELHEYAEISIYLFVCFSALLFYRFALLEEHLVTAWRFGLAVGKALILGKFILIGKTLRIGERGRDRTLLHDVAMKSLLFLVLLLVLSVVEEVVIALIHGRPVSTALSEAGTPLELCASSLLMVLILIPYFAFLGLDKVLGAGTLRRTFLQRRDRA